MVTEGGLPKGIDRRATLSKGERKATREPLTLIMGMKCVDGILIVADSQEIKTSGRLGDASKYEYKDKIKSIGDSRYVMACAGVSKDIRLFEDYIKKRFNEIIKVGNVEFSYDSLLDKLREIVFDFCSYARTFRDDKIYSDANKARLKIDAIFGACLEPRDPEKYGLYRIAIYTKQDDKDDDVDVESMKYHCTIGTGEPIASAALNSVWRMLKNNRTDFNKLTKRSCALICNLIIVKTGHEDPQIGGQYKYCLLDSEKQAFPDITELKDSSKNTIVELLIRTLTESPEMQEHMIKILKDARDLIKTNPKPFKQVLEKYPKEIEALLLELVELNPAFFEGIALRSINPFKGLRNDVDKPN